METIKLIIDLMDGTSHRKVLTYEGEGIDPNDVILEFVNDAQENGVEISATHKYSNFTQAQLDLPELSV